MSTSSPDPTSEAPTGPLDVVENCWMVGRRNPTSLLQCNTFIRTFESGSSKIHLCVDPGSRFDYPVIEQNVRQLLGDVSEITTFSLNHQDPDVVGNSLSLCEANPNISAMMTEEVWRLAQHLGFEPKRVHFANAIRSDLIKINEHFRWQLVPTPFCHFRGAVAFYDPELRTLYSGDLFAGLNQRNRVHLWAREEDWHGIAQFHQIYMPTREALRYAVKQIRALNPPVEIIAPQHGHLIKGEVLQLFLDRMNELPVGLDLFELDLGDKTYLGGYSQVLDRLLEKASELSDQETVLNRLRTESFSDGLSELLSIGKDFVILKAQGYSAIVKVFARLAYGQSLEVANTLRAEILLSCSELGLPVPPVGAGLEEEPAANHVDAIDVQPETENK